MTGFFLLTLMWNYREHYADEWVYLLEVNAKPEGFGRA